MPKLRESKIGGHVARARRGDEAGVGSRKGETLWPGVILVLVGLLAYGNSFQGVMLFDDIDAVILNSSIQKLRPISEVLNPPAQSPMAGRPVVNLTLAFNYSLGGLEPRGYHAVNLAIHLAAGLVLWGLLRRTWPKASAGRGDTGVTWPATIVALIWIVHPLQTESVTYIVQRAEALAGLFYLLTLYCTARGIQAAGGAATTWFVAAVMACSLGMATKENMATAPLMAMLLDYVFFSRSIRETLLRRWVLYVGLAGTWLILAGLMAGGPRSDSAGFHIEGMGAWDYAASQPLIILHYLRLAFWPHPLCLDYSWPIVTALSAIAIPATILTAAALTSLWALWRRPALGFLGAWFFVVLAPTSSFVPLKDLAFEHRMYLPLAAIVVLAVGITDRLIDGLIKRFAFPVSRRSRIKGVVVVVVVGLLCILTMQRNADYSDAIGMWQDVAAKRPNNARAYVSLGVALGMAGQQPQARLAYVRALEIDPGQKAAQANLGKTLAKLRRYEEALAEYRKALVMAPDDMLVRQSLGIALEAVGRFDEAIQCYDEILRREPTHRLALLGLGACFEQKGNFGAAAEAYRKVMASDPANLDARCNMANCLMQTGKAEEAVAECRGALKLNPKFAPGWYVLGNLLLAKGQWQDALDAYVQAVRIDQGNADARCNMGVALERLGRIDEAIACHEETLKRFPRHVVSRFNLADLLTQQGRLEEAMAEYSEVLKIEPGHASARAALDRLTARQRAGGSS